RQRGISLMEILTVVTGVGILATITTALISDLFVDAREQKQVRDVETLNRAVLSYLGAGGNLDSVTDPRDVLTALKRRVSSGARTPGLAGSKIDPGMTFELQSSAEASSSQPRIYWDSSTMRFYVATSGESPGIERFYHDPDAIPEDTGDADANFAFLYAGEDNWIWDYADVPVPSSPAPLEIPTTVSPPTTIPPTPTGYPTPPSPSVAPLDPPDFSVVSGTYPIANFDLSLVLANPNPTGSSAVYYSLNYGSWQLYSGPLSVSPDANVAAMAIAMSDLYTNSSRVDHAYGVLNEDLLSPAITFSAPQLGLFTNRSAQVTLTDLNPPGVSTLEYRIAGGPWLSYAGPFTLSRDDYPTGAMVQARAMPTNPYYNASTTTLRTMGIEPLSITGDADGEFYDPTGESGMVTNLTGGARSDYFNWGDDSDSNHSKSYLDYTATTLGQISGQDRFRVGTIDYFNGTIANDSGATAISFSVNLDLDINSIAVSTTFDFDFELVNTANDSSDPWGSADFVRMSQPIATEIIDINGVGFQLQLEFGETTENGISYFDEFHVLENSSAATQLYGTLIEVGTIDFNQTP
ncbi:MAG: choice-of-anchor K domain-containing protein, partial [Verrucomicrobiota bacterium]